MHANIKVYGSCQWNGSYFTWFNKSCPKTEPGCSIWISLHTTSNFILIRMPAGFTLYWSCAPSSGQSNWMWYKMVKVNGAYRQVRYGRTTTTDLIHPWYWGFPTRMVYISTIYHAWDGREPSNMFFVWINKNAHTSYVVPTWQSKRHFPYRSSLSTWV